MLLLEANYAYPTSKKPHKARALKHTIRIFSNLFDES